MGGGPLPPFERRAEVGWVVSQACGVQPVLPLPLPGEIQRVLLAGGEPRVVLGKASEGVVDQLTRPLGIPLGRRRCREHLARDGEQCVLDVPQREAVSALSELVAELPGLRAAPQGPELAALAVELPPLRLGLE